MKPLVSVSVALALGSLPAAAIAQVTQTYQYDANGRLTGVTTTGSAGTNSAAYTYDDADNRTSRSQTGTTAYATLSRLPAGDDLGHHQALVSPDGRYSLAVRDSGSLELWADQAVVWSNGPEGTAHAIFTVDDAGNARFRDREATASPRAGTYVALQSDGDLVLRNSVGAVIRRFDICC